MGREIEKELPREWFAVHQVMPTDEHTSVREKVFQALQLATTVGMLVGATGVVAGFLSGNPIISVASIASVGLGAIMRKHLVHG